MAPRLDRYARSRKPAFSGGFSETVTGLLETVVFGVAVFLGAVFLGAVARLVVVVSHVAELRHRIEDLIELDRSPVTGTTTVVHA